MGWNYARTLQEGRNRKHDCQDLQSAPIQQSPIHFSILLFDFFCELVGISFSGSAIVGLRSLRGICFSSLFNE